MAYPNSVLAYLDSCSGSACGMLVHELRYANGASPPQFRQGEDGDFTYGRCTQRNLGGGQYTWELHIIYENLESPCDGDWTFRLVTPADNPVGNYGLWDGQTVSTSAGQAHVTAAS